MSTLFVPRERGEGEERVAGTPETIKRLVGEGLEVVVEAGAGDGARITDDAYRQAGATITEDAAEAWARADLVCTVGPPRVEDAARMRPETVLIGLLAPHRNLELVRTLTEGKVTAVAMELIPRITRAQPMDALSSQATLAGYRAVILAAYLLDKHFPLYMTAAGTIKPAKLLILGAGVAGLAAVATAKRLGAVVEVSDIREAAQQEVESLGGNFIVPPSMQDDSESGGYAREVGEDALTLQQRQLADHAAKVDAVIGSAFVPGRPAPPLITEEAVEGMRPGSVIIDLAASEGGNCVLTEPTGTVEHSGVRIVAAPNLPAEMPGESSALYARNLVKLVQLISEEGTLALDREDEIVAGALLTADGEVHHEDTAERLGVEPASAAPPAADTTAEDADKPA